MLSIDEARNQIAKAAIPINQIQTLTLQQAFKRVAAQDLHALVDAPPADNSAMDGYAIQLPEGTPPWFFQVSQSIQAGQAPQPLQPGTAARILTGANIPEGADTVVIQEDCDAQETGIWVREKQIKGANIRPCGQDFSKNQRLIKKGDVLDAAKLGLLAAAGHQQVDVLRRPRIALINTGSELIEPGKPLQPGQIYNSNATLLSALLTGWGCHIERQIHLADDLEQTQAALKDVAGKVDLIITSGGVSVGDEDHVKTAITALGRLDLWKINLKPGKPLAFGMITESGVETPIIGLPGNPVSSFVTMVLFVKSFINGLYGRPTALRPPLYAPAQFDLSGTSKRPELVRVRAGVNGLEIYPNQSSGVLSSLAWADALALIEPERMPIQVGDRLPYFPLLVLTEL